MCGNVGVAGFINVKEEAVLRTLLILDCLRGEHSTGIAAISRKGDVSLVKKVGDPFYLLNSQPYDLALRRLNRAIIGHNRYATMGGISEETAHPFEFDTLVGAHNGTLVGKYRLADANKFKVDSENLYHHIEQHSLKDALSLIQGAWSLVWWNKVAETLNFLRNKERPMWLATTKNEKTIFWASEPWMLDVACQKAGMEITEPVSTEIDKHYCFIIDEKGEIGKPKIKAAPATYVAPVYVGGHWHGKKGGVNSQQNLMIGTKSSTNASAVRSAGNGGAPIISKLENGLTRFHYPNDYIQYRNEKGELVSEYGKAGQGVIKKPVLPSGSGAVSAGKVAAYKQSKNLTFEITGRRVDDRGAPYLTLLDIIDPAMPVRYYLRKNDEFEHKLGREVQADIGGYVEINGEGYFKTSPWGMKLVDEAIVARSKKVLSITHKSNPVAKEEEQEDETALIYMGKDRRLFTRKEWTAKYSTCCWCFNTLNPDDRGNKIVPSGDCICGDCCANLPEEFVGEKLYSVI